MCSEKRFTVLIVRRALKTRARAMYFFFVRLARRLEYFTMPCGVVFRRDLRKVFFPTELPRCGFQDDTFIYIRFGGEERCADCALFYPATFPAFDVAHVAEGFAFEYAYCCKSSE